MPDTADGLMTDIAKEVFPRIPAGWIKATVTSRLVTGCAELSGRHFTSLGGEELSFIAGSDALDLFEELREVMYEAAPAQGAWYIAILSLTPDGKFSYKFDYDDTTQFKNPPDPEDFEDDLKCFPRAT